jgi:reactive intermediate/imine deaminase
MSFRFAAIVVLSLGYSLGCAQTRPLLKRSNPAELARPTGYTHVVEVTGGRTLYISGQVALERSGAVVGEGNLEAQVRQVFENLKTALTASGATFRDVVKITIFMTDASQIQTVRDVRNRYFTGDFPASTLVQVGRLARPEFLIEIEAMAVVE